VAAAIVVRCSLQKFLDPKSNFDPMVSITTRIPGLESYIELLQSRISKIAKMADKISDLEHDLCDQKKIFTDLDGQLNQVISENAILKGDYRDVTIMIFSA